MRCSDKKRKMYIVIEKIAALFCDKIICISDAEKESGLKICSEDKLHVIFNGVDIEAYEKSVHGKIKRDDLGIPDNAFDCRYGWPNKFTESTGCVYPNGKIGKA